MKILVIAVDVRHAILLAEGPRMQHRSNPDVFTTFPGADLSRFRGMKFGAVITDPRVRLTDAQMATLNHFCTPATALLVL